RANAVIRDDVLRSGRGLRVGRPWPLQGAGRRSPRFGATAEPALESRATMGISYLRPTTGSGGTMRAMVIGGLAVLAGAASTGVQTAAPPKYGPAKGTLMIVAGNMHD